MHNHTDSYPFSCAVAERGQVQPHRVHHHPPTVDGNLRGAGIGIAAVDLALCAGQCQEQPFICASPSAWWPWFRLMLGLRARLAPTQRWCTVQITLAPVICSRPFPLQAFDMLILMQLGGRLT